MTIDYKGYTARVEVDLENDRLIGRVMGIRDAIVFHSDSVPGLRDEMKVSVDDYLDFCQERGVDPAKPYSGRFSIRMSPDTHRQVEIVAAADGASMNQWINEAITTHLERRKGGRERGSVKKIVAYEDLGAVVSAIYPRQGAYGLELGSTGSPTVVQWKVEGKKSRMDQMRLSLEA